MPPTTRPASRPDRRHLLDALEAQVNDLRRSERWATYLSHQARFHRYSPRNVLLITMQRPEATQVAGYRTWQSLGRNVRRGEQALSILAPMRARGPDDEPRLTGFRWVSVFDVEQTEGDALVSPVSILEGGDKNGLEDRLAKVALGLGLRLEHVDLPTGVNGELRWSTSTLAIRADNPGLQRAKTIAHELGHFLLHRHETNRARAEIEAESVAYVVMASLGADATSYSAGYIASWLEHDDGPAVIARSCESIQRAAAAILDRVATAPAVLVTPRGDRTGRGAA